MRSNHRAVGFHIYPADIRVSRCAAIRIALTEKETMPIDKIAIGRMGEEAAVKLLKKNGCKIIAQNFRCRWGELDIIAKDGDTLVFVEVKTRGSDAFGRPGASVDARKQQRMITASSIYMSDNGIAVDDTFIRFDVIEVDTNGGKVSKVGIIKDAFST